MQNINGDSGKKINREQWQAIVNAKCKEQNLPKEIINSGSIFNHSQGDDDDNETLNEKELKVAKNTLMEVMQYELKKWTEHLKNRNKNIR